MENLKDDQNNDAVLTNISSSSDNDGGNVIQDINERQSDEKLIGKKQESTNEPHKEQENQQGMF